jgi:beta-glucosidase/6-phospho-beta-glucosidase/beta-galactosidase
MHIKITAYVVHYVLQIATHFVIGKVGIVLKSEWAEPETNSTADREAAEKAIQYHVSFILCWTRSSSWSWLSILFHVQRTQSSILNIFHSFIQFLKMK